MWGRVGSGLLIVGLMPLSVSIAAPSVSAISLSSWLNQLSQDFSVPFIYSSSSLKDLQIPQNEQCEARKGTLDEQLSDCLMPLGLSWEVTSSGILIFTARTIEEASKAKPDSELEEVTVTGHFSASSPEAYNQHYNNATDYARQLKSRAVGEQAALVGAMLTRLPAENLAEALQALPGLSITRDRGEALNISAMGLSAEYQMTLLNGHRLANTENVRNSNQYGQQYRFDTLSAGLFNEVALYKTANVQNPSGASGATVDLRSDNPLAYEFTSAQVRLTAASLEGDRNFQPGFALIGNVKNSTNTLAAVFRLNYENRLQRQYQFETWHWGQNVGAPDVYHWPEVDDNTLVPTDGLALTIENEDRTRSTYYGNVAWQPNMQSRVELLWLHSDTDFSFDEHRLTVSPQSTDAQSHVGQQNSLAEWVFNAADIKSTREESSLDYANDTVQLTAQWQPSPWPALTISPFLSRSEATSVTRDPISRVHIALDPVRVRVALSDDNLEQFNVEENLGLVGAYSHISQMSKRRTRVINKVTEWGVDATYHMDHDVGLQSVKMGALLSNQQHDYRRRDVRVDDTTLAALPVLDGRWLMPTPHSFQADFFTLDQQHWLIPKSDLFQLYDIALSFGEPSDNDLLNSYAVTFEAIKSYINSQWQLAQSKALTAEAGVRVSHTNSETVGAGLVAAGNVEAQEFTRSDTNWFPSAGVKWQWNEQWQWRAGYVRSQNRPNYSDMNPKIHVNSGGLPYAEAGNPLLKPVLSDTVTTSINYQSESLTLEMLGFAHKLTDYISEQVLTLNYNGTEYNALQRTNNSSARIQGLQLGTDIYLPAGVLGDVRYRVSANTPAGK